MILSPNNKQGIDLCLYVAKMVTDPNNSLEYKADICRKAKNGLAPRALNLLETIIFIQAIGNQTVATLQQPK